MSHYDSHIGTPREEVLVYSVTPGHSRDGRNYDTCSRDTLKNQCNICDKVMLNHDSLRVHNAEYHAGPTNCKICGITRKAFVKGMILITRLHKKSMIFNFLSAEENQYYKL